MLPRSYLLAHQHAKSPTSGDPDQRPTMASLWTILLSVAIVAVVTYLNSRTKIPKGLKAVPGPKPLPVIGSALELSDYPEKKYMEWAREYGELFQVQLGWNNWIFVCSDQAVKVQARLHRD
jgi:hypothetical protein